MEISPKEYTLVVDEYGNQYAEFDFSKQPAGTTQTVNIDYRVDGKRIGIRSYQSARGSFQMILPNPNCISNPPIPRSRLSQRNCREAKVRFASRCGRFMITSAISWSTPTTERIGERRRPWGPWGPTARNTLLCWWRSAGRKAFRLAISKDCCISIRERMPSPKLSTPGRMCTCPLSAGSHWIPPWDGRRSTGTLILPTIRQIILSSRWGRTRLCCGAAATGRISTGRGTAPGYG